MTRLSDTTSLPYLLACYVMLGYVSTTRRALGTARHVREMLADEAPGQAIPDREGLVHDTAVERS
jgi:hypothetical protein